MLFFYYHHLGKIGPSEGTLPTLALISPALRGECWSLNAQWRKPECRRGGVIPSWVLSNASVHSRLQAQACSHEPGGLRVLAQPWPGA